MLPECEAHHSRTSPVKMIELWFVLLGSIIEVFETNLRMKHLFFREEKGGRKMERNISVWLPLTCPSPGDLTYNPGMCPDWESNWHPFGSQASAQSTEPHQSGQKFCGFFFFFFFKFSFFVSIPSLIHSQFSTQNAPLFFLPPFPSKSLLLQNTFDYNG